jgi:DNA-binding winged helix-turn-helix (wHTH) protein/tetratricopeptide (TPR) repeat protein
VSATDWLQFGNCELNVPRRELRLDGVQQVVPPKVYDLLLLLVRQRDRVVPKKEIEAALWPGKVLSDSVIARTVMKVRRSIGDSGAEPKWITSVHGFGYRFVGEVRTGTPPSKAAEVSAASAVNPQARTGRRIGVLPCVNATGDATLDWMRYGLMSLVEQAFAEDSRLAPVPLATMLEAVSGSPTSTLVEERAEHLMEALGIDHVAHAIVSRQGLALWLDYRVFSRGAGESTGSLRDDDAVVLGERFARELEAALFPGSAPDVRVASRVPSRAPFVRQTFARAIELFTQEDHKGAAHAFAAVCSAEPENMDALQWQTRCLALMGDPAAVKLGESLLARASASGDVRSRGKAHALLWLALAQLGTAESAATARIHADAALVLARDFEHEDWAVRLLINLGMVAWRRGQTKEAFPLLAQAEAACRATGNSYGLSRVQQYRAWLELESGNLQQARQDLDEAYRFSRRQRRNLSASHALLGLGMINAALGSIDTAVEQCDESLALLGEEQIQTLAAAGLSAGAQVYGEIAATEKIERLLSAFDRTVDTQHALIQGPWLATRACLAQCRGDVQTARPLLRQAIEKGRRTVGPGFVRNWSMFLLRTEVAAEDFAAVEELRRQLESDASGRADRELQAGLMHAQAAQHLHRGDAAGAERILLDIVAQVPPGREFAVASLDAAWLCLLRGAIDQAGRLLDGVGAWRQQHPIGISTEALWHFAARRRDKAVAAQRHAVERHLGPTPAFHEEATRAYATAASFDPASVHPGTARLVSATWLPYISFAQRSASAKVSR